MDSPDAQTITVNVLHGSVYAMGLRMLGEKVVAGVWEGGGGGMKHVWSSLLTAVHLRCTRQRLLGRC